MAKINFGTVVSDARGKIGGVVMSKNKSGAYVRTKVTPVNPRSPAQQAARANFADLAQAWSGTLTASERAAWTSFAQTFPRTNIFGNSLILNGLNMYVSLNAVLLQIGVASVASPPVSPAVSPASWDTTWGSINTSALTVTETAISTDPTPYNYLFATKCLPPGRAATPSDFRLIFTGPELSGPGPINVFSGYNAKFGAPIVGTNIYGLIATVAGESGCLSVSQPISGTVT